MAAPNDRLKLERRRRGWTQRQLANRMYRVAQDHRLPRPDSLSDFYISRWERGVVQPGPYHVHLLCLALELTPDRLGLPGEPAPGETEQHGFPVLRAVSGVAVSSHRTGGAHPAHSIVFSRDGLERLRQSINEAIADSTTSEASLTDWEQTVLNHGRATRDRSPIVMLSDLTTDFIELQAAVERSRSASTKRRLTRVTAQMAGLMCLALVKLDERDGFRKWARTARIAAQEINDPATYSWVLAQEAYGHYYAGDLVQAIEVAHHAQALAGDSPFVGAALAAALEARAHAALGNDASTRAALERAQAVLAKLDSDSLVPSAFGYTEAQLRFHEGSALTHLGDTNSAWRAQERALALAPSTDYTDRALTRLDRAACLVRDGDVAGAVTFAEQALTGLTPDRRRGIITIRARDLISALPAPTLALPAARDLQDFVTSATAEKDEED
jgi:tetratricopeptide (TPR) repeat protein/transcriptional regulator with XRE-family HTH domain